MKPVPTREIPLSRPYLDEREEELVLEVLRSGRLSLGPTIDAFEEALAARVGVPYAAAVSSGTAGLHLLCHLAGFGSGDEVITSPFSFVSSANCFMFEGATPVFADVDPRTFNLDPAAVEAAITERTRGIVAVDIFGYPCELDELRAIADRHGLALIDDACEALGAEYRGAPLGSHGPSAVFAFYPNKQMATGEGGVVTTHSEEEWGRLRSLRNQGRAYNGGGWFHHVQLGFNYRWTDVQAAIGLAQLEKLDEILARRAGVAARYSEALASIEGVETPLADDADHRRSWFVYVVKLVPEFDRDGVMAALREQGIATAEYVPCIHLQPYMRERYGFGEGLCPVAEETSRRTLALPFAAGLELENQERVVATLKIALERAGSSPPQRSPSAARPPIAPPGVSKALSSRDAPQTKSFEYDLFVSHASEDKDSFVRPLVEELEARGLQVWFDEAELEVGDSLTEKIESGLRKSRFCALVLSPAFFAKRWTRSELNSLVIREIDTGERVVLPIWLDVQADDVRAHAPLLADRFALRAVSGLPAVAAKLAGRVAQESPHSADESSPITRQATAAAFERELDPLLLRGRIYPYSYSPIVRSDERALVARVAVAARVPTAPAEPALRSREQKEFEDAVVASRLETLLRELSREDGPTESHLWRRIEPTRSWIVTVARAPVPMPPQGWIVDARAAISLKPAPGIGPSGWLIVNLDVAVRPVAHDPAPDQEPVPLSLEDTYALLYMPMTALLEDIAPHVLPLINPMSRSTLLAVGCLLLPIGDALGRYLRLETYADDRAEGALDASGIEWYAQSLDELDGEEARAGTVRERLEMLFIDGGYVGHEPAVQRLGARRVTQSPQG